MCGKRHSCSHKNTGAASVTNDLLQLITKIAKSMTTIVFQKGQILFYEGHIPCGLFIIKEGRVEFSSEKTRHDVPAPVVGFQHILDQTPYCATCTAATKVKAIFLSKTVVEEVLQRTKKPS